MEIYYLDNTEVYFWPGLIGWIVEIPGYLAGSILGIVVRLALLVEKY